MARRVYFSFHYEQDIWRANVVRNHWVTKGYGETGVLDASLWEEAKTKGDAAVKKLIDQGLNNTSVTCFLIGEHTYSRKWCKYELKESLADKKGILGILLPNQSKHGPKWISNYGKVYKRDHSKFPSWVEQAAKDAGR